MPVSKNEYLSEVWKDGIFDNKVVFCTGGAGTICSAQVRAMVHLGADACIVGRNVEKTERMAQDIATARKGARVIGIGSVDVRKVESLQDSVETCVKELGAIDYVIAGAAGNFLAPISQLSSNAFKSVMDIDVLGSYNTLKATLPHLYDSAAKHRTDGISGKSDIERTPRFDVFNFATLHYTGTPLQAHVSVAKAGVDALSTSVSIEAGPRGVTSNIIAPGPIGGSEGIGRLVKEEQSKAAQARVPVGRFGTVKEVADATVYLFSDAGNFVNGEVLVVDGGSWRTQGGHFSGFSYPGFFLADEAGTGAASGKKSKL
ncbi:MAG: hypothetical protein M1837_004543 [Sclerophora amabilis]|nr:MAG: hypothetical protein M1837_004543 [Sclerophora amabilis]